MPEIRVVASGLRFPEGPVAMADGSVILGEIAGSAVTRIAPGGAKSPVGKAGGGPNGVATGPDGALYVCNNGGNEYAQGGFLSTGPSKDYQGGYIQRIDPRTGDTKVLYSQCSGHKLSAPNDLVFDRQGGFYFTDLGKRYARQRDHGGLYYALPDGSKIVELVHPMLSPNGVGLSPDEKTVYVADTLHRAPGLRAPRLPALRQPCRRSLGRHLRRDVDHRPHHRDRTRRPRGAAGQNAGCLPDQHLLWRQRHENSLYFAFRHRPTRRDGLARAGPSSKFCIVRPR